ncbi:MAG TPA: pyrroloquinoline quinone biosynthesis protein PqqB [Polyangiaceae bacterium]|nr:pyrroloquinoline quinone biosynthesis protein PqqB [Polyangiaceae bacterium]
MLIHVLGSAAGGGVPQWNCGCDNCRGVRNGSLPVRRRTQECVAVSADGESWFLLNASPEIRQQIESFPAMWPRAPRHSPIAALVLTNGDLDHCLGLFSLRESHPLKVYATPSVRRGVTTGNVFYRTLERFEDQVTWTALELSREVPLAGVGGEASGLAITAIAAPGKLPLHLEGIAQPSADDNVGLKIRDTKTGKVMVYFSGAAGPSPLLRAALGEADCVFFDGTFWSSDELIGRGLGQRRAEDMAHWPVGGVDGSAAYLAGLRASRRVLIHLNNTNPALVETSKERAHLTSLSIEVAYDGMEFSV